VEPLSERPAVSVVVVTYRSSGWCPRLLASVRGEAAAAGLRVEVVVVDHSEAAAEVERLRGLGPDRLVVEPNRGFAAGVNAGIALAAGETVAVVNPDVELHEGALAALLAALDAGWDVVAPQCELAGFRFPPADRQTPGELLARWLAARSPVLWRRFLGRELAACVRVWQAAEPVAVPALSGACLLFRRELAARAGRWDEGYFLYFEETDWLRRVRRAGGRLATVPRALARHEWGHAADPAMTMPHYLASRRRFVARHHPLLGRVVGLLEAGSVPLQVSDIPATCLDETTTRWWLLSPTSLGLPAAGLAGTWLDLAVGLERLAADRPRPWSYLVSAVGPDGAVLGPWRWRANA
jgi:GT2 family glycosyltransferase